MKFLVLAVVGLIAVNAVALKGGRKVNAEAKKLDGLELVNYVNSVQSSWKAELSPKFAQYPNAIKQRLMGVKNIGIPMKYKINQVDTVRADIPASFDSRQQWPNCPSINNIRDQSSCGSCWAFGAAEAMTDRTCIQSNGAWQDPLSADDILACCGFSCGDGCEGGYPIEAWQFWVHKGVVTGGNYTSKYGCMPYPFAPCEHHTDATHYKPCPADIYPTPKCSKSCAAGWKNSYSQDKQYGKSAYSVSSDVKAIQTEVMTNGPVEVAFEVYADFEQYKSGVYVHTGGSLLGGHAVKLIGWGTDQASNLDYWLIANSWNTDWGEQGYFRIIRGQDECGIESGVVAGLAKV
ncbi:unnamed protein product, partial [Mesorhabditis belari]|uniref:Peptidase C1A papain C-terminal domain-containing protein n=1 Tax=Mesorhabditis belari TaxID=2138241 RepID=A0AAF3J9F8_9BILA